MLGAHIEAPDINYSYANACLKGETIHLGLDQIMHLSKKGIEGICKAREKGGNFSSLTDVLDRADLNFDDISYAIYAGALRSISRSKGQLIIEAKRFFSHEPAKTKELQLFNMKPKEFSYELDEGDLYEDAFDEMEGPGISGLSFAFQSIKDQLPWSCFCF